MDLTKPISYRNANLNTAFPTVGKPGIIGCITEGADVSQIDHVGFTEKRRLADGMDAIEPYVSIHRLTLQGTIFGQTRGEAWDALQVLREAMNPVKALMQSPTTKGFLPFDYVSEISHEVQARPMGLRYEFTSQRSGTNAKVAGKNDAVGIGIRWAAELLVGHPDLCCDCTPGESPPPATSCATVLSGLSTWDSGIIAGGPPCVASPSTPSANPATTLAFMTMINDNTAIGPPIIGPSLAVSGFTEVRKYQGAPAAYEHSLMMLASKATTGGSPGSMSCTFTGNGCEAHRTLALVLPTSATAPVQSAQQDTAGPTLTLPAAPTPGNILIMFRHVETLGWSANPGGTGWTRIGSEVKVKPGGISEHTVDVWCRCVVAGDPAAWSNGDASFSHWSFLTEWALT